MPANDDNDYKAIFAHPDMVKDMLTAFVPGDWVQSLDFATLEPYKSSFVIGGSSHEQRHADLIWRVRGGNGDWVYVYLLLEFQSAVNPVMAMRMLAYVALLYLDLHTAKQVAPDEKMPFVLPLVIYNGRPVWTAAQSCAEMISPAPPGMEAYSPQMRYFLIDENRINFEQLRAVRNRVALLFELETRQEARDIYRVLKQVLEWFGDDPGLSNAFAILAKRVVRKKFGVRGRRLLAAIHDLKGVISVLEENLDIIEQKAEQRGVEKGIGIGEQRGVEKGIGIGEQRGIEKGMGLGIEKGLHLAEQKLANSIQASLATRFGPLPAWAVERLQQADMQQLMEWLKQVEITPSVTSLLSRQPN